MWIRKLLSSLDHDLDTGLARVRAKTLGKGEPKMSLGAGRVRVFQDGELAGSDPGRVATADAPFKSGPTE